LARLVARCCTIFQKLFSDWPDENFASKSYKKALRQLKQRLFASEKFVPFLIFDEAKIFMTNF